MKSSSITSGNIFCFCYDKLGHKAYSCDFKKLNNNKVEIVWVLKKFIMTNPK